MENKTITYPLRWPGNCTNTLLRHSQVSWAQESDLWGLSSLIFREQQEHLREWVAQSCDDWGLGNWRTLSHMNVSFSLKESQRAVDTWQHLLSGRKGSSQRKTRILANVALTTAARQSWQPFPVGSAVPLTIVIFDDVSLNAPTLGDLSHLVKQCITFK